jgi:hypothetical protein
VRLVTIAVVLVFALVGAGCGGDDETSGNTDTVVTDTTTDETTTDETTTEDTTEETETEAGGGLASGDCEELIEASAAFSQALATSGGNAGDLDDVSGVFDELAESAPEEIRADFQVLAEAYTAYADVLADVEVEPGEVPDAEALAALQQAIASIDQAEVSAASQRITTWSSENC